jgi:hypothetical protein
LSTLMRSTSSRSHRRHTHHHIFTSGQTSYQRAPHHQAVVPRSQLLHARRRALHYTTARPGTFDNTTVASIILE